MGPFLLVLLSLYVTYKKSLAPPYFAYMPSFPARDVLVKARINDLTFWWQRPYGCPYCTLTHLPEEEDGELSCMVHLFVECAGPKHPKHLFLDRAKHWLPPKWAVFTPLKQLAHLLLLPETTGAFLAEAARTTAPDLDKIVNTVDKRAISLKKTEKANKKAVAAVALRQKQ